MKPFVALDIPQLCSTYVNVKELYGSFACKYMSYKLLATLSPLIQWFILCIIFGNRFMFYGIDVLTYKSSPDWPNPQDVLFPYVVKCEMHQPAYSTNLVFLCYVKCYDIIALIFLIYWFWMMSVFVVNTLSFLYYCFHMIPCVREHLFGTEKIEHIRSMKLRFSHWLLLRFIKTNLKETEFRKFLNALLASTIIHNDLNDTI